MSETEDSEQFGTELKQKHSSATGDPNIVEQPEFEEEYRDYYADADTLRSPTAPFARGIVLEEFDIEESSADSVTASRADRKLHEAKILDRGQPDELEETAYLLVWPDETRMFIGNDPTSKETVPIFGFVVRRTDPMPSPATVDEALNMLKPAGVMKALESDEELPLRQGEWWLLETDEEPTGSVFKPGVSERPFGGSPLDNHVPREYALDVPDEEFMERFQDVCPELADKVETPHEAFSRVWRGFRIAETPDVTLETDLPELREMRSIAERVFVRGSLRHRENDHYMENVGEEWMIARTHHIDVYTADSVDTITRPRID